MVEFTDERWEIVPAEHDNSYIRPVGRKIVICETYTFVGDEQFEKANARLIAAAPCLLAALEAMLRIHGKPMREDWMNDNGMVEAVAADKAARAAIAKAREGGNG